jgi:excisionase family DNA binding protein
MSALDSEYKASVGLADQWRLGVFWMSMAQAIPEGTRRLGDAKAVGRVLDLSWRTVYRLADAGKIPAGFKLGASRRLDLAEIEAFIAGGCKPPRAKGGR